MTVVASAVLAPLVIVLAVALIVSRRELRRSRPALAAKAADHAAIRHRIEHVVERRALDTALQPIIDLDSGRLRGFEALARFRDGRPPDVWLAEAVQTGQALALDLLAFTSAVQLSEQVPQQCYLSVNATPELLLHGRLAEWLINRNAPLERLVIELTEHVKISSYSDLHDCLAQLRERGVRLAIDDTGAGYASFNHVLQLRPDIIKIDRSLIANVTADPARRSLVTALVLLALDLDATVVAEGVETSDELSTLASLGVDCAQGFLLARPSTDQTRWQRWTDPGRVWNTGQLRIDGGRSVAIPDRPLV